VNGTNPAFSDVSGGVNQITPSVKDVHDKGRNELSLGLEDIINTIAVRSKSIRDIENKLGPDNDTVGSRVNTTMDVGNGKRSTVSTGILVSMRRSIRVTYRISSITKGGPVPGSNTIVINTLIFKIDYRVKNSSRLRRLGKLSCRMIIRSNHVIGSLRRDTPLIRGSCKCNVVLARVREALIRILHIHSIADAIAKVP